MKTGAERKDGLSGPETTVVTQIPIYDLKMQETRSIDGDRVSGVGMIAGCCGGSRWMRWDEFGGKALCRDAAVMMLWLVIFPLAATGLIGQRWAINSLWPDQCSTAPPQLGSYRGWWPAAVSSVSDAGTDRVADGIATLHEAHRPADEWGAAVTPVLSENHRRH